MAYQFRARTTLAKDLGSAPNTRAGAQTAIDSCSRASSGLLWALRAAAATCTYHHFNTYVHRIKNRSKYLKKILVFKNVLCVCACVCTHVGRHMHGGQRATFMSRFSLSIFLRVSLTDPAASG